MTPPNILALDLGTNTGYAFNNGHHFECGTILLATDREIKQWGKDRSRRRCDPRVLRLHTRLVILQDKHRFTRVVFEDVQFGSTTYQTQLWSSFRTAVWLSFPSEIIECVPVQTLKLFATGHGGADKASMARSLVRHDKRFIETKRGVILEASGAQIDDNAVDAVWMHRWAQTNLSRSNYVKPVSKIAE
jgi:hypothetical protein